MCAHHTGDLGINAKAKKKDKNMPHFFSALIFGLDFG